MQVAARVIAISIRLASHIDDIETSFGAGRSDYYSVLIGPQKACAYS